MYCTMCTQCQYSLLIVIYNTYMISLHHVLYMCTQWPQYSLLIVIYNTSMISTPCSVPCVNNDLNILYWLSYITHTWCILIMRSLCMCMCYIWQSVENIEVIVYTWYSTWCILIMYVLYMTISREYCTHGHCVHMVQYMVYVLILCMCYIWQSVENIEVIVYTWYSTWCILIMYVLYMTISREYWGHCVHMVQYMVCLSCMCYIWQSWGHCVHIQYVLIMYVLYMTISREYWGHCVHMVQYMVYAYHVCVIYDNQ